MSNKVTGSVARLMRAGNEHSKAMEKLRESVDTLVTFLASVLIPGVENSLPCSYTLAWWPSGDYELKKYSDNGVAIWMLTKTSKDRGVLLWFAGDISRCWLDEVSLQLEKGAHLPKQASDLIDAHLTKNR